MTAVQTVAERVAEAIRDVPDFPSPGIVFKDIGPLLADPSLLRDVVDAMATPWRGDVDLVAGIDSRGFLLGTPLALALDVGFLPVRKQGKLPGPVIAARYQLEYGEAVLELQPDLVPPGARVLVVDDVLATGGTVAASLHLLARMGAAPVGAAVLLELGALRGRYALPPGLRLDALLTA